MSIPSMIATLFQAKPTNEQSSQLFRAGQIFYGRVHKLYPGQHAEIQFGSNKMIAKLEVPLTLGAGHWFQVTSTDKNIKLKIIEAPKDELDQNKNVNFLRLLGLPHSKQNKLLASYILKENLLLSKKEIINIAQILSNSKQLLPDLEIIKWMNQRHISFNEKIFHSLSEVQSGDTMMSLLKQLHHSLVKEAGQTTSGQKLLLQLSELLRVNSASPLPLKGKEILHEIQKNTGKLGMFYESSILREVEPMEKINGTIKPLLVRYLEELQSRRITSETEQTASKLINRMNGFQILSSENGPIQQTFLEVPLHLGGFQTNMTMQWTGSRTKEGKISSDFCKIVFYLNLQTLGETIIDVNVQNRVLAVEVYNEKLTNKSVIEPLIEQLKNNLNLNQYYLSKVELKQLKKESSLKEYPAYSTSTYRGVDIRI